MEIRWPRPRSTSVPKTAEHGETQPDFRVCDRFGELDALGPFLPLLSSPVLHLHIHICIYIHIISTCTYTCTYKYVYAYTCTYTGTYTHTHTHMYTNIYLYAHSSPLQCHLASPILCCPLQPSPTQCIWPLESPEGIPTMSGARHLFPFSTRARHWQSTVEGTHRREAPHRFEGPAARPPQVEPDVF